MKGKKGIRAGWAIGNPYLYKENHERAIEMREKPTEAEAKVWEIVRASRLGVKFRRQQTIGEYIVDFYCLEKNLVIELDGSIHQNEEQRRHDKERDEWMEKKGYRVVRIRNEEVMKDTDVFKEKLMELIHQLL